jgi:hypothetical protein
VRGDPREKVVFSYVEFFSSPSLAGVGCSCIHVGSGSRVLAAGTGELGGGGRVAGRGFWVPDVGQRAAWRRGRASTGPGVPAGQTPPPRTAPTRASTPWTPEGEVRGEGCVVFGEPVRAAGPLFRA